MSWVSVFAIIPVCLSTLGILLTLATIIVLLKHKDTPIVRASGIDSLECMYRVFAKYCSTVSFVVSNRDERESCSIR